MKRVRIPKISKGNNGGSIRLRWTYQGKRYCLSGFGDWSDSLAQSVANVRAEEIKRDIRLGTFDPSLENYQSHHVQNQKAINKHQERCKKQEAVQWSLVDVWNFYKDYNTESTPATTQKNHWKSVDNALAKISNEETLPDNAYQITPKLLEYYTYHTLQRVLASLVAASNLAFNCGHIPKNHWKDIKKQLPKKVGKDESKRTNKAYTVREIKAILEAFESDRFCSEKSAFDHSHYYPFVEFLILTGCRPGEAIALTWDDIDDDKIRFNKSYSLGELKSTKNGKTRHFPLSKGLKECIARQYRNPVSNNSFNLVFPSPKGGYINLQNFTTKIFNYVINCLWEIRVVRYKLPTYNLRNTSASFYLRNGVDRATIAKLFETSGEMLDKHYFAPDDDIELPEI